MCKRGRVGQWSVCWWAWRIGFHGCRSVGAWAQVQEALEPSLWALPTKLHGPRCCEGLHVPPRYPAPKGHDTKQPIKSTKTVRETAKKGNNFFLLSEQGAPDFLFALDPTNDVAGRGSTWCPNLRSVRVLSCCQGVPTRTAYGGLIRALPIRYSLGPAIPLYH